MKISRKNSEAAYIIKTISTFLHESKPEEPGKKHSIAINNELLKRTSKPVFYPNKIKELTT